MKNLFRFYLPILFFLSGCTLQDHNIPATLAIETAEVKFDQSFIFGVQAEDLGDRPVTEYGILYLRYYKGGNDGDFVPRIGHGVKMIFTNGIVQGLNEQAFVGDWIFGGAFLFYRAYAILSDGSVVYGGIMSYSVR